jgi:hypothetical protein
MKTRGKITIKAGPKHCGPQAIHSGALARIYSDKLPYRPPVWQGKGEARLGPRWPSAYLSDLIKD